jgi:formate dehydrogenase maturation protein FdhE
MTRTAFAISIISAALLQTVSADEIRHTTFPNALLGTWAETAQQCAAKDKSNIVIEAATYGDASGSCAVRWIVETAGSQGANYAVHALCASASQPTKTQLVNIIIRPQGADTAAMGRSFAELKTYRRCSAQ